MGFAVDAERPRRGEKLNGLVLPRFPGVGSAADSSFVATARNSPKVQVVDVADAGDVVVARAVVVLRVRRSVVGGDANRDGLASSVALVAAAFGGLDFELGSLFSWVSMWA